MHTHKHVYSQAKTDTKRHTQKQEYIYTHIHTLGCTARIKKKMK